ncbi:TetR/AcrR family transcriptional regulator [Fulvivirga sp. 29W222]|uniref:TetR/AcrR family transcriptional regulator n=1 Tax=Fulvivirga marina TaxID=2494733 RepID=A0A937FXM0_9BACT|nr:TetR/AcrR family transcriptional regulator [Fulvivirga marina]MBL6446622.1 TetR/AcrR family transcriptional regulator [Fulvivirga marina]
MSKTEQTKAHIIEKTAPVFNTKGFVGTSLSDMEKATGLTKGSIYNNFKNKDAVALAVFDHNLQITNNLIEQEMGKHSSAKEQLLAYTEVYLDNTLQHLFPQGGCPMLNTAVEADDTHPELKGRAAEAVIDWKNKIAFLIRKGVSEGEFREYINVEQAALTIFATVEGAIMISKVTGKVEYLNMIMGSVRKMIYDLQ